MFRTVTDFTTRWKDETAATQRTLDAMTDASLSQCVLADHRSLGRIAWHVTGTVKEMMERTGLALEGPHADAPVPGTAKEIAAQLNLSPKTISVHRDHIKEKLGFSTSAEMIRQAVRYVETEKMGGPGE